MKFKATEEDRIQARKKLNEARQEGTRFRRDFLDSQGWDDLAKERRIRLPAWWIAPTPKNVRKWTKRIGMPDYREVFGFTKHSDFADLNPDWPLRALIGILLERGKR